MTYRTTIFLIKNQGFILFVYYFFFSVIFYFSLISNASMEGFNCGRFPGPETLSEEHCESLRYLGFDSSNSWDNTSNFQSDIDSESSTDSDSSSTDSPVESIVVSNVPYDILTLTAVEVNDVLGNLYKLISHYTAKDNTQLVETSVNYVKDVIPPSYWAQTESDIAKPDLLFHKFIELCQDKADLTNNLSLLYFQTACYTYNVTNAMDVQDIHQVEEIFTNTFIKLYVAMTEVTV